MKKTFFKLSVVLSLSLICAGLFTLFISCSSDDDSDEEVDDSTSSSIGLSDAQWTEIKAELNDGATIVMPEETSVPYHRYSS